jgi:hypothetical protein
MKIRVGIICHPGIESCFIFNRLQIIEIFNRSLIVQSNGGILDPSPFLANPVQTPSKWFGGEGRYIHGMVGSSSEPNLIDFGEDLDLFVFIF